MTSSFHHHLDKNSTTCSTHVQLLDIKETALLDKFIRLLILIPSFPFPPKCFPVDIRDGFTSLI